MATYVALLYSITLGPGRRLKMDAWRAVLAAAGAEQVRTALSTGNAIFEASGTTARKLETQLEDAFEAAFGKRIDTIVRPAAAWRRLAAANPFPQETANDPGHVAVRVMRAPLDDALARVLAGRASSRERVAVVDGDLWLYAPEPPGKSRVVAMLSRERSGIGTIRAWSTVRRLAEMLDV